jgi:adenosylcobinamide amidohydrolase
VINIVVVNSKKLTDTGLVSQLMTYIEVRRSPIELELELELESHSLVTIEI